jgi:hypothetical protein
MRYLLALLMSAFMITATTAQQPEDHDYSVFRQVKDAVQEVLVFTAKKYGGESYDMGKLQGFVADTSKILASVEKEYPNTKFAVMGDATINTPETLGKGFMFVTTIVEYGDKKGTIQWEFNTVFGVNEINFYSVQMDGKPKSFDDYNHWNHLSRRPKEDKENKTEQGL